MGKDKNVVVITIKNPTIWWLMVGGRSQQRRLRHEIGRMAERGYTLINTTRSGGWNNNANVVATFKRNDS